MYNSMLENIGNLTFIFSLVVIIGSSALEDELQGRVLLLLARRGCLRLGDGDRQTWAVERSALQVGHDISMQSSLICSIAGVACGFLLLQLFNQVDGYISWFYDSGPEGEEWCSAMTRRMPFNPFQAASIDGELNQHR